MQATQTKAAGVQMYEADPEITGSTVMRQRQAIANLLKASNISVVSSCKLSVSLRLDIASLKLLSEKVSHSSRKFLIGR